MFIAKLQLKCINDKYFMWDMFFIVWYISSNNSKNLIKVQIYESQNSCKLLIWKKNNSYVGGRNNKDTLRFWTFELIWTVFTNTHTHTFTQTHTQKTYKINITYEYHAQIRAHHIERKSCNSNWTNRYSCFWSMFSFSLSLGGPSNIILELKSFMRGRNVKVE